MLRKVLFTRAALFAALAAASVPAGAAAASVSIKGKCYVAYPPSSTQAAFGESIPVEIEEVTPGREVRLTLEVKGVMTSSTPMLTVGKNGTLDTSMETWTTGMGEGPTKGTDARMVLRDFWLGTELGSASLQVANVAAYIDGELLSSATKRRWIVSGLSEISKRSAYYAHYYLPSGKKIMSQYLGKTQDRCGFLRVKKVVLPGHNPDKFEIRVQASPSFKDDEPYVPYSFITVTMPFA